jgi:16S rRNA (guanine1516-N2)-methyltransferase
MTQESTLIICVAYAALNFKAQAQELAEALSLSLYDSSVDRSRDARDGSTYDYLLEYSDQGLVLRPSADKGYGSILCDFASSEHRHRRRYGGGNGQAIAKAVGVSGKFAPQLLDITAGLGGDGFVLASLGCSVSMLERNPIVHSLLADGLSRGLEAGREELEQGDDELWSIIKRLRLHRGNAAHYLSNLVAQLAAANIDDQSQSEVWRPDVVYVDPMFPLRKKSAKVKKEMQAFHGIVGGDEDASELLELSLARARYRVVVKRSSSAGYLADTAPSYSLEGKSTRFDVFALQKLPG